jgi:hypothetical protein
MIPNSQWPSRMPIRVSGIGCGSPAVMLTGTAPVTVYGPALLSAHACEPLYLRCIPSLSLGPVSKDIFSIRVIDKHRNPVEGVAVTVDYGFWQGTARRYTDADGCVEFPVAPKVIGEGSKIVERVYVRDEVVRSDRFDPEQEDSWSSADPWAEDDD